VQKVVRLDVESQQNSWWDYSKSGIFNCALEVGV
jgi:hypothetical protein